MVTLRQNPAKAPKRRSRRRANQRGRPVNQGYQRALDQTAMATIPPQRPRNAPGPKKSRKQGKMPKKHLCLDPMICRWAKLHADPFNAPFEGVHWPINENAFPCQRMSFRNYATSDISALSGTTDIGLWFFPMGPFLGENTVWRPVTGPGASGTRFLGPACDSVVAGVVTVPESWCFVWRQAASFAGGGLDTMLVTAATATNAWVPFEALPEVTLQESQAGFSSSRGRTIAYGIRISYTGDLGSTRGYVEFVQPPEYPTSVVAVGQPNTMSANRRGAAYRRHYFSSHRTFTYVWEPICDEIDEVPIAAAGTAVTTIFSTRLAAHIGGIEDGDQFTVEVMSYQEFSGRPWAAQAQATTQSPDAAHLANAMTAQYGMTNSGGDAHGREIPGKTLDVATFLDKARYAVEKVGDFADVVGKVAYRLPSAVNMGE